MVYKTKNLRNSINFKKRKQDYENEFGMIFKILGFRL